MKGIDRLLKKAKRVLSELAISIFTGNEDGFMDALGVDLELYAVNIPDGSVGYDFLKALNDTSAADWAESVSEFGEEETGVWSGDYDQ